MVNDSNRSSGRPRWRNSPNGDQADDEQAAIDAGDGNDAVGIWNGKPTDDETRA